MPHQDPRIDTYIAKSADFAKPILTHLRALVHQACPEAEETIGRSGSGRHAIEA
jgi:hypothetical protein